MKKQSANQLDLDEDEDYQGNGIEEIILDDDEDAALEAAWDALDLEGKSADQLSEKFNENHDELGRFASGSNSPADHTGSGLQKPPLERAAADFPPANPDAKISKDRYQTDGKYTKDRQELHDAIAAKLLAGHEESSDPTMYMLGGGTASGKTQSLQSGVFGIPKDVVHIDSDAMKAELPDYKEMVAAGDKSAAVYVHKESSDISVQVIKQTAAKKYDAIVDTTGDNGMEYLENKVAEMRQAGHKVIAHYVTVDTDTAVARSAARAKETGRDVPESLIRGIHKSVSEVLPQAIAKGLFDHVTLWDTNEGTPRMVMEASKGEAVQVHDEALWQRFLAKAG